MTICGTIIEVNGALEQYRKRGEQVGFVPTMGALHEGHISLIKASLKDNKVTVCSIFVNPTQFNDKNDLARYPRMPEKDARLLEDNGCDVLFLPAVEEMYPNGPLKESFDFGHLDKILEGAHRPGHFNGVAQVVKRFFEIVTPDKAFFGSKDYQQVMIVKALIRQLRLPIELVACPILREPDGLAMSSRNALLTKEERKLAGLIPGMMQQAAQLATELGIAAAKAYVAEQVSQHELMKLDYYEICDADTLEILNDLPKGKKAVALIALFTGRIRLIDNLAVNS